jgi:nitrite reductase/ring-hydroxylating ferredoxin subunit
MSSEVKEPGGSTAAEKRRERATLVQRRLVHHVASGLTTDLAPTLMTNAAEAYTDADRAKLELEKLFMTQPLVAGLSMDIPDAGDVMLFEELGRSIVIARGEDGLVRAFLNMCTHRGSRLVSAGADGTCARRGRLTCPFHAWSFSLEGRLIGISSRFGFDGMDAQGRNLVPVPVKESNGVIFVRPSPGTAPLDVSAHLGAFETELSLLNLESARPVQASVLTAETNWKSALDTYCESYHFGVLHASTIGVTHYSDVAVFEPFEPHWRVHFPEKALAALARIPESDWPPLPYGGIHFIFPNTILVAGSMGEDTTFVRMFRLFPGVHPGVMSCRISVHVSSSDPDAREAFAQNDVESNVTQEDYRMAVEGYANLLAAPPGFEVIYGRNEIALQAVHQSIARALGIPAKLVP